MQADRHRIESNVYPVVTDAGELGIFSLNDLRSFLYDDALDQR